MLWSSGVVCLAEDLLAPRVCVPRVFEPSSSRVLLLYYAQLPSLSRRIVYKMKYGPWSLPVVLLVQSLMEIRLKEQGSTDDDGRCASLACVLDSEVLDGW